MPTSDSFLFDVGWLFFAAWSVVVILLSLAAFGKDLFPALSRLEPQEDAPSADVPRPTQVRPR